MNARISFQQCDGIYSDDSGRGDCYQYLSDIEDGVCAGGRYLEGIFPLSFRDMADCLFQKNH